MKTSMKANEMVVFEKCPLCGLAEISVKKRRFSRLYKDEIGSCPNCSAEFARRGADNFELTYCEPRKLGAHHKCEDRVVKGCYLDSTFSRSEWERIAVGDEPSDFARFLDLSARFRQGLLPTYPSERLPFHLGDDEILHYISFPVFVDEQRASKRGDSHKGRFFITSDRIVYESHSAAFTVQLENVERVDEAAPGFVVKEKGSYEPRYFFPPPYDPVCAAVLGAIHSLRRKA